MIDLHFRYSQSNEYSMVAFRTPPPYQYLRNIITKLMTFSLSNKYYKEEVGEGIWVPRLCAKTLTKAFELLLNILYSVGQS